MSSIKAGETYALPFIIGATELAAGTSTEIVSPVSGFIEELQVIVQAAVTTGGAVTVQKGTTDVTGLSVTVADAATKGTIYSDTATAGTTTRAVSKGDRIQVTPAAAFATAGAISGNVIIRSADLSPLAQY